MFSKSSVASTGSSTKPESQAGDGFGLLFKDASRHACQKGQILVFPDEEPRGVFYIKSGYVKAYTISNEGQCQLVAILSPGEVFPLYWALDGETGQLYYEAMNEVEFNLLEKSTFKSEVMQSKYLLGVAVKALLATFKFSHLRIRNLQLPTARERLAFRLLYLANNFGERQGSAIDIQVPIVYQDLADAVNITRETTNRIMRRFITDGLIKRTDHHMTILAIEGLRSIVG
jgi:CRP-like cAMP-binding protein